MSKATSACRRLVRPLVGIGLMLGLGACSAPQIAYNKLDWLAGWELRKFVQLKPAQKTRYKEDLQAFWDWHRRHELPSYASDLRAVAPVLTNGTDSEELLDWLHRTEQHWNRSIERVAPDLCAHLAAMDTQQIASILQRLDHDIAEIREEFVAPPEDKVRRDSKERLLERLRHWLGNLNDQQLEMVAQWSEERPLNFDQWLSRRQAWRHQLMVTLAQRDKPGFCPAIHSLFGRHREDTRLGLPSRNDATHREWSVFLADILNSMTQDQKRHLTEKLKGLAEDFEALAADRTVRKTQYASDE